MENLDSVKYTTVKAMLNTLEKNEITKDRLDKLEISFEFIIGSLFPKILDNIHNALNLEHTKGYLEGLEYARNEKTNN